MDHLARLVAHVGWADARVLGALRAATALPPAVLELYAHVLGAEQVWLARLTGSAASVPVWPALSLDECARLAEQNQRDLTAYVAELTPGDLGRGISYRNSAGRDFTSTVEDILLHLALHGAYHRGQIAIHLRHAGATPEPTDFIAFVRGAPAATRPPS